MPIETADTARFSSGAMIADRYRIVEPVGRGGMGEVYRAEDLKLCQTVALKFLPADLDRRPAVLEHFLGEARIARQITHPNVCRVYDVGEAEGRHFLSMELIEGGNLADLLGRLGRLPSERVVAIGREIAQGLDAIHREGIVHRDLKPANLMLDAGGRIRITDFGIAEVVEEIDSFQIGLGTPAYMAPEQIDGEKVTTRSDLYSLGLVLYELATGNPGFIAQDLDELFTRRRDELVPPPPEEIVPDLDPVLARVIRRCLAPEPDERPSSASSVAAALGEALGWRAAPDLEIPRRSGWRLERKIGEGGFGEVWIARHARTGQRRVFKFCYEAARKRSLEREITLFRLLKEELGDRPDIARIFDWNFEEMPYFLEVEYTDAGDLAAWAMRQGGLAAVPLERRLEIVTQVATALQAAHSVGVLHKDVKPSNVLIRSRPDGIQAQLADFGIGEIVERQRLQAAGITVAGLTLSTATSSSNAGTRLYMAPELLEGKVATVQADIYALGVLLFQMVVADFSRTLAPGWERDVDDELLRDDIGAAVDGSPERRLASAAELAERIRGLEERRVALLENERRRRAERESARRMRQYRWGTAALLALLLLGVFYLRIRQRELERTESFLKLAVANDWLDRDPTLAGRVLLEVEDPQARPFAVDLMRRILQEPLAYAELEHLGPVHMAEFDPTGERVLTASSDGWARLWDVENGRLLARLEHGAIVRSARFGPDGQSVVTASEDGLARLWQLTEVARDGTRPTRVFPHGAAVLDARFSPGGDRVVTACVDGGARVWILARNVPPVVLQHEAPVRHAIFHPSEDLVLTASEDGTARLWRADGVGEARILRHGGPVLLAVFGPETRRVMTTSRDGQVRLWNPASGRTVTLSREADGNTLLAAAFSPEGNRVAVASFEKIWVWEIDELRQIGEPLRLQGHESSVLSLEFTEGGTRLLSASHDGTARLSPVSAIHLERAEREEIVFRGHRDRVMLASLDSRNHRVVTTSSDGTARLWNIRRQEPRTFLHPGTLRSLDVAPDGTRFATAALQGTVRVWSWENPAVPVLERRFEASVEEAVFDPRGEALAIAAGDGVLRLLGLEEGAAPRIFAGHQGPLSKVAFAPDGTRIATASLDGTARIWSLRDGLSIVLDHQSPVRAIGFDFQGERLATGTADGSIRLWNRDGIALRELAGHEEAALCLAWSRDGKYLASGSLDGAARIWSLEGDRDPWLLRSDFAVFAVAFSSDGKRFLSASGDETVKVLIHRDGEDPWGGEPSILDHSRVGGVLDAAFDGAGRRIVSGTDDGSVWIWPLEGEALPQVLRGHRDTVWAVTFHPGGDHVLSAAADGTARLFSLETNGLERLLASSSRICLDRRFRQEHFAEGKTEAERRFAACERKSADLLQHPQIQSDDQFWRSFPRE